MSEYVLFAKSAGDLIPLELKTYSAFEALFVEDFLKSNGVSATDLVWLTGQEIYDRRNEIKLGKHSAEEIGKFFSPIISAYKPEVLGYQGVLPKSYFENKLKEVERNLNRTY